MAVLIKMQFGMLSGVSPGNHILDGSAHWRHLANTIEPSLCGDDAALYQITLTILYTKCHKRKLEAVQYVSEKAHAVQAHTLYYGDGVRNANT